MAPLVKRLQRSVPCFFAAIVGPTSQALQGSVNECLAAFIFCVGRAVSAGQWPLLWLLLTLLGLRQQGAWGRTHDVRKRGTPLPGHLLRARACADASRFTDEVKDKGNANRADDKDGSDGAHSDFANDRCSLEGARRGRGGALRAFLSAGYPLPERQARRHQVKSVELWVVSSAFPCCAISHGDFSPVH